MWGLGLAVAGARECAQRHAQACAAWAEHHIAGFPHANRLTELAECEETGIQVADLLLAS